MEDNHPECHPCKVEDLMPLKIVQKGGLYSAEFRPYLSKEVIVFPASTPQELYNALKSKGAHPIDILEALDVCDPDWSKKYQVRT
jgi:hypothetical protein